MQRIINGLLYDTRTAELIHTEEDTKRQFFKTPNGRFFMFYPNGEISPKDDESAKDYLSKYNVKKYIKIFGEPEEA